ncbi:MAG: PQQ-binding-like beta-propeller repeat protein [Fimbriimonas sp.]
MVEVLGHPILLGEQFLATSMDDLIIRWTPKTPAELMTIAHPPAGTPEPDLTPVTMFGGYPIAMSASGLIVADDQMSPFFGSFSNLTKTNWHLDISHRLGIPCAYDSQLFTNVGGTGALSSLVALNAADGKVQWEYSPQGLAAEPISFIERSKPRAPTIEERTSIEQANRALRAQGIHSEVPMPPLSNSVATPVIRANHGFWENPGLVVVKENVYGQVLDEIVALNRASGDVIWKYELEGQRVGSIAADKTHLFISLPTKLLALDLDTGKQLMELKAPGPGTLTIANGMLFLSIGTSKGGQLLAFRTGD